MIKTRNGRVLGTALVVAGSTALVAAPASAQTAVSYSDKLNGLVTDNAAILAILAGIVVAIAGFALFKRLSNKA